MTLSEMRTHMEQQVAEHVSKADAATDDRLRERLLGRAESINKYVAALTRIIGDRKHESN